MKYKGAQPVIEGHEDDGCIIVVNSPLTKKKSGVLFNNFIRLKEDNTDIPTILDTFECFKRRLPENMLPIARDPGSGIFLLTLKGEQAGSIMYWGNLPGNPITVEEGHQLALAASSLLGFIDLLEPAPQLEDWGRWESENL